MFHHIPAGHAMMWMIPTSKPSVAKRVLGHPGVCGGRIQVPRHYSCKKAAIGMLEYSMLTVVGEHPSRTTDSGTLSDSKTSFDDASSNDKGQQGLPLCPRTLIVMPVVIEAGSRKCCCRQAH